MTYLITTNGSIATNMVYYIEYCNFHELLFKYMYLFSWTNKNRACNFFCHLVTGTFLVVMALNVALAMHNILTADMNVNDL